MSKNKFLKVVKRMLNEQETALDSICTKCDGIIDQEQKNEVAENIATMLENQSKLESKVDDMDFRSRWAADEKSKT